MNHKGTKVLKTKRLILRPYRVEDAPHMYENWANDPSVTKYLTWLPHENVEDTKILLEEWVKQYTNLEYYQWGIAFADYEDVLIGAISVVNINSSINQVSIGYCIGKRWWHQGITSEAFTSVIQFLFHEVGVNRIEACHDPKNQNSGMVMKKCGLSYEGTLRQSAKNNQGNLVDLCIYAIVASDLA